MSIIFYTVWKALTNGLNNSHTYISVKPKTSKLNKKCINVWILFDLGALPPTWPGCSRGHLTSEGPSRGSGDVLQDEVCREGKVTNINTGHGVSRNRGRLWNHRPELSLVKDAVSQIVFSLSLHSVTDHPTDQHCLTYIESLSRLITFGAVAGNVQCKAFFTFWNISIEFCVFFVPFNAVQNIFLQLVRTR